MDYSEATQEQGIPTFSVLGTTIHALTPSLAIASVKTYVASRKKSYLAFCTVSTTLTARDDPTVRMALNDATLVTPDGMPLVWIGRRKGHRVERVYGPDFMIDLFAATRGEIRHYFYGGAPDVAEDMARRLKERFPDLVVVGTHSPEFGLDPLDPPIEDIERINSAAPDIVWVGLGHPKQEIFAWANRNRIEAPVIAAVGAAFDFHSGRTKEAPAWMKRSGLQWLHRLASEPRRLWRRYLVGNTKFIVLLTYESLFRRSRKGSGSHG